MPCARPILLFVIVASICSPALHASPPFLTASLWSPPPSQDARAPDLSIQRTLIAEADTARQAGDYAGARAMVREAVDYLAARARSERDVQWLELLDDAGRAAWEAQDPRTANAAWQAVLEFRTAALPDEHPGLQVARLRLSMTLHALGDFAAARALQEKVLNVQTRTLPDDHSTLARARHLLAITLVSQGELDAARALQEKVLDVRSRTLPDEDLDLQAARSSLATTLFLQRDLTAAGALQAKVLEVQTRTLSDERPELQTARGSLASTLFELGDLAGARALMETVLEVGSRTLPDDHPDLQIARMNLANTLSAQGDLATARALLEKVLEVQSSTLPDDHPDLQTTRMNLANTLRAQGDLAAARALQEKVLEVQSRTQSDEHPDLQSARLNLANTLSEQGELAAAGALYAKVFEVQSRTVPDEHPDLLRARWGLANTLLSQGDFAAAQAHYEAVLEVYSRTLPEDHPDPQLVRLNLATAICKQGDFTAAQAHYEAVLESYSRTLPDEHPHLQMARLNLALMLAHRLAQTDRSANGEDARRREMEEAKARCTALIGAMCRAHVHAARAAILASSGREAEERCASIAQELDACLSFAQGFGVLEPLHSLASASFAYSETTRGGALAAADLTWRASSAPNYGELRAAFRAAVDELAALAQRGTTSEAFDRARRKRESVERELARLARELSGAAGNATELDVESLAQRLAAGEAAVAFRRYTQSSLPALDQPASAGEGSLRATSVPHLCAFVVRPSKAEAESDRKQDSARDSVLSLVDLGPIVAIERAATAWRDAIGVGHERGMAVGGDGADLERERGEDVRRLVLDPLLPALAGTQRIVMVLDDVLHLVPLEALPLSASAHAGERTPSLVGDRWRIESRATLTELLTESPPPRGAALVALGGASFNVAPIALSNGELAVIQPPGPEEESAPVDDSESIRVASHLRGTVWERGFAPLPYTGDEARGIGALYTEIYEDERPALVLEKRKASRDALFELAPKARYLHIATHGWFAPESIKSWSDVEPIEKQSGLGPRMSGEEQVKGMSPMLLCGLALAGANLPEDVVGRTPGLVTADELSTLDLSNCELAVLSACDTNVGERRAGQGVASLQKALQMAGARSVITSLWKVPDEATKELMLDFYRRLWVEKKPKHQALWEAKTKLREAKDESGAPKYTTRDWAAWVLTGDPR